jgi:uncharacterized protein (TIGR00251 family)
MKNTKKCYLWQNDTLLLDIQVQPGAKQNQIVRLHNHRLKIRIAAPPIEGKANRLLLKYVSEMFKVRRTMIKIVSGETRRDKRLSITAPQMLPEMISSPKDKKA